MGAYIDLLADIGGWLNRPEAEPWAGSFVRLAETQINRAFAQAGITGAQARTTMTVEGERVGAPSDLARPLSIVLDGRFAVGAATPDGVTALRSAEDAAPGRPRLFTIVGAEFLFYPAPDRAYAAELVYQTRLEALSDTTPSNWVLASHYDAYLFGALSEAATFLGGDPRAVAWQARFEAALAQALAAERGKRGSRATPAFRTDLPIGASTYSVAEDR